MKVGRARALESMAAVLLIWVSGRALFLVGLQNADFAVEATPATKVTLRTQAIPRKHRVPLIRHVDFVSQRSAIPPASLPSAGRPPQLRPKIVQAYSETEREYLEAQPASGPAVIASEEEPNTPGLPLLAAAKRSRRIQAGFWMLWRPDGNGVALGAAGQLGGSQAGLRAIVPIGPDNVVRGSLRMSTSFMPSRDRELAPGLSVRPLRKMPVELVVERRLRAGSTARDATAVFAAAGVSAMPMIETWEVDAYGQAGVVGARQRLWFADGAAMVRRPLTANVRMGAGLWAGIQPGLKRIDIGPSLSTRLAPDELGIRLDLDWRIRIAGDARPETGLAVTIAKDF